jgi:soluble lytic murein transglycosylase-like protein
MGARERADCSGRAQARTLSPGWNAAGAEAARRIRRSQWANVRRSAAALLLLGALFGCSGGGFVPYGPHALGPGVLKRIVADNARSTGLSPKLIAAVIATESGGDPAAVSRAGAEGLMQLMPGTAASYGVTNPFDPEENVSGGSRYLRDLLVRYHHHLRLALAAYNAGPGAVDAVHGVPSYPETRAYVSRVTAALNSTTN